MSTSGRQRPEPGSDDELERSRAAFAERVERRYAARPAHASVGKGSPAALLTIGIVSTIVLVACVLALGGGLLLVPALLPLVTVVGVLVARAVVSRRP